MKHRESLRQNRKSFSARARRERREEIARLEALEIVRYARAAGLHGTVLRAYVADDERQASVAVDLLAEADIVAVSLQALCEFAWVLDRQYQTAGKDIAAAIRALLDTANVVVNRPAVEAGLSVLEAGGARKRQGG